MNAQRIFTLLLLVFFSNQVAAQQPSSIKAAALDMGNALVQKNSSKFISYMHPVMISLAGGEEQLRLISDSAFKVFEQFGGRVSRISFGNPSEVIKYKKTLQAVIPQTITLTSFIADVEVSTSMIAVSEDAGLKWKFIDTNLFSVKQIKSAMPDLSPDLVIPKSAQPKVTMKQ